WFPDKGQREAAAAAKAVCQACPVMAECLAYALALGIRHGVLGGTTPEERDGRKTRRQRPAGPAARMRKAEAERDRRRRLHGAAEAGDPAAADLLERDRARKRTPESLAAARERARRAMAAAA